MVFSKARGMMKVGQRTQGTTCHTCFLWLLFGVAQTNMVPTAVGLWRVLSQVATPIALRHVHVLSFRFVHAKFCGWAPCQQIFEKGNHLFDQLPMKRNRLVHIPKYMNRHVFGHNLDRPLYSW